MASSSTRPHSVNNWNTVGLGDITGSGTAGAAGAAGRAAGLAVRFRATPLTPQLVCE